MGAHHHLQLAILRASDEVLLYSLSISSWLSWYYVILETNKLVQKSSKVERLHLRFSFPSKRKEVENMVLGPVCFRGSAMKNYRGILVTWVSFAPLNKGINKVCHGMFLFLHPWITVL